MENLRVIVNVDVEGKIVCLCLHDDYLRGYCECRDKYNCPEAIIEDMTVIPNSRPSDKLLSGIKKTARDLKKATAVVKKANDRIKQGVSKLERDVRKNHWRN